MEVWWHKSTFKQWLHLPSLPICQNLIKITPQIPLDTPDPTGLFRPHWTLQIPLDSPDHIDFPDPTSQLSRPHWTPQTTLISQTPLDSTLQTPLDYPDHIDFPDPTRLDSPDHTGLLGLYWIPLTTLDLTLQTTLDSPDYTGFPWPHWDPKTPFDSPDPVWLSLLHQ